VPVVGLGEARHDALRRIELGGWFERAGESSRVRDAIQAEGAVLADPGIVAGDVPAARVGDDSVRVQRAFGAAAVAAVYLIEIGR
jgi:hypothetical protein